MGTEAHGPGRARAAATSVLAYAAAAAVVVPAASVLNVELELFVDFPGRSGTVAEGLSWVVLLLYTFVGSRGPARALVRASTAGLVVNALFPLCLVLSVDLRRSAWSELGGLGWGLAVGSLLLLLSLVVNPGLCAVQLLAQRAVGGFPRKAGAPLGLGFAVIAYGALGVTCVLLARYTPFTVPATAAATVGGLTLMAWPHGPFALRAAVGLAGPYAVATGAAALAAPVLAAFLWSALTKR